MTVFLVLITIKVKLYIIFVLHPIIVLKYRLVQTDVSHVDSITFDTSKGCRVGRDFEQLPASAGRVYGG